MPFTCSGCRENCLYAPTMVGRLWLCVDCAKDPKRAEKIAASNSQKDAERGNARAAQYQLFPVHPDSPSLIECCWLVRENLLVKGEKVVGEYPTDQLHEFYEILRVRLDAWEERDYSSYSATQKRHNELFDKAAYAIVVSTSNLILAEIKARAS